jgi:gluconate transporter
MPSIQPGAELLLPLTALSIALLLTLILWGRLHAFLALLLTSIFLGLSTGMAPARLIKSIQSGVGEALGFIAVVVALGSMLGRFLEHSGGGQALGQWLLRAFGPRRTVWAVLSTAFLVGLPIFFEVAFVILLPLARSLGRESKKSLLFYGLPIAAALTVTHAMVPPHPAPAAAAQLLGANMGLTILYGALLSIPMAIAGGVFYGQWIAGRIYVAPPEEEAIPTLTQAPPAVGWVVTILLLPVVLIFASTLGGNFGPAVAPWLAFIGHPFLALTIAALAAMYFFGFRRGLSREQVGKLAGESLAPMASLLLIMGGGGAFKQVIVDSGVGPYAGQLLANSQVSPLLLAYFVASAMRMAQGSATVAIITAAGIVAPLVKDIPGYSPEMIVLSLCAGGTILSHVNDAGFWLVNQSFQMSVPDTLRSWTVMKVITSLLGMGLLLILQALLAF